MAEEILFSNEVSWKGGSQGDISFPSGEKIDFALPKEFGGIMGFLSPEDIYVAAANACVLTTTLARAKKYCVSLKSYSAKAQGVMEKAGDGWEVTQIGIKVILETESDPEILATMIDEVAKRVPVIRSMRSFVDIDFEVKS